MASYRENLVARRDAIAAELAAMSSSTAGGKPNVKTQDGGTTIDHVGYRKSLLDELKMLGDQIKEYDDQFGEDGSGGAFEVWGYADV